MISEVDIRDWEKATHIWEPNDEYHNPYVIRLHYYRKNSDGQWEVFSKITGWRLSSNDAKWFEEETRQGFFKELNG